MFLLLFSTVFFLLLSWFFHGTFLAFVAIQGAETGVFGLGTKMGIQLAVGTKMTFLQALGRILGTNQVSTGISSSGLQEVSGWKMGAK